MTNKTRIQKLESVKHEAVATPVIKFTQEVRADGNKFYIDGVQVDAAKYAEEHAEYMRLHTDSKTPNELIIHCNDESEHGKERIRIYATE